MREELKPVIIGIDPAIPGADYSIGTCPKCLHMQKVTSDSDYWCKHCSAEARRLINLGVYTRTHQEGEQA